MAILNYTTKISSESTVQEIQKILARAGASAVLSEYDNEGILCALSFRLTVPQVLTFKLPANFEGVLNAMKNDRDVPRRLVTKEQAARVAWRILKNWIDAQMAIVQAQCAETAEVFLPYLQNNKGQTLYEQVKGNGFLPLEGPKK